MRIVIFLLLFVPAFYANAQKRQSKQPELHNEWLVKFSPVGLVSLDAGPEFFIEYFAPKRKLGFQLELQPILYDAFYEGNGANSPLVPNGVIKSSHPLGFELRPEIKWYVSDFKRRSLRFYFSLDMIYKYTDTKRLGEFAIYNGGTDPVYFKDASYNDIKNVYGGALKGGFIAPFRSSRFMFELSFGLGLKYRKFSFKNLPIGGTEPLREAGIFFGNTEEVDPWAVAVPLSVRLVYRIK